MAKHVVVTGANTGIGFELSKILIRDHDCYVYLGSRSLEKGNFFIFTDYELDLKSHLK